MLKAKRLSKARKPEPPVPELPVAEVDTPESILEEPAIEQSLDIQDQDNLPENDLTEEVEPPSRSSKKPSKACPYCGSTDLRRAKAEGFLFAFNQMFGRWPFRCRSCRAKLYRAAPPPPSYD